MTAAQRKPAAAARRVSAPGFDARCLSIVEELLRCPTAPLHEQAPQAHIRRFVAARPALSCREDNAGNLLVKYPAHDRGGAPLVMVAHLDHPGFHVAAARGRELRLFFRGRVAPPHARAGQRIRIFTRGAADPAGSAVLTAVTYARQRLATARARLLTGAAATGDFAMWDFPPCEIEDGRIAARNCDDGIGAGAALCVLEYLARRRPAGAQAWALFTRAEEFGFLGALEAVRLRTLPRTARVLSLEASRALPEAPQGGGVIVRVGDAMSIFDPTLTEALRAAAAAMAAGGGRFRYMRRLMDGGTCEATVFRAAGYSAAGLAIPLGNYHNQACDRRGRPGIGAEEVRVADFLSEVRLLRALAANPALLNAQPGYPPRLATLAAQARTLLSAE